MLRSLWPVGWLALWDQQPRRNSTIRKQKLGGNSACWLVSFRTKSLSKSYQYSPSKDDCCDISDTNYMHMNNFTLILLCHFSSGSLLPFPLAETRMVNIGGKSILVGGDTLNGNFSDRILQLDHKGRWVIMDKRLKVVVSVKLSNGTKDLRQHLYH